jgi:hypothetical protein
MTCLLLRPAGFATLAAVAIGTTPLAAQSTTFDRVIVARRGAQAPGAAPGLVFEHFGSDTSFSGPLDSPPALDQDGAVAFSAVLGDGNPSTFETNVVYGIWRRANGALAAVRKTGDNAPGLAPSAVFTEFPSIDGQTPRLQLGRVVFSAQTNLALPRTGIWSDRFGPLELVLVGNENLPGMPANHGLFQYGFALFGDYVLINGNHGSGAFIDPDDEGIWLNRTGAFEQVAVLGQAAPGMPAGVTFSGAGSFIGPFGFWTGNRAGQVMFHGNVDGQGIDLNNDEGLWLGKPGALALVAREGEPIVVPGMNNARLGSGTGFQSFVAPTAALHVRPILNDRGQLLIGLDFRTPQFDGWVGVFTMRNGTLQHVVTASENFLGGNPPLGDQAVGFPSGYAYVGFPTGDLNEHGEMVLAGRCSNANVFDQPQGMWVDRNDGQGLRLIAGQNRPLPVVPGATCTGVFTRGLGDDGGAWCEVTMSGAGITAANDQALLVTNRDGTQQVVLREGDLIDVDGLGDLRPIVAFHTGPGIDRTGGRVVEVFCTGDANLIVHLQPRRTLTASDDVVELGAAPSVGLDVDLGPANANRIYVIAGSLSGPAPGVTIGALHVPLNVDFATNVMLGLVNGPALGGFLGVLDAQGRAQATFTPDQLFVPAFAGQVVTFTGFVPFDAATNAVPVVFRP